MTTLASPAASRWWRALALAVAGVLAASGAVIATASPTPARAATAGDKPKVVVVATGGTIAGRADGRDTYTDYRAGTYPMADLVGVIQPEVSAFADVEVVQFGNSGSGGYTIPQYRELSLTVQSALADADAVVVTTGTDTMEEFAYWLDLTVQNKKPVVITGAMRPWAAGATASESMVLGADGPANLLQAIRLAASQATFCFGTVLMLNDEIHAARDVTKGNATRNDTFVTRMSGVLGWIDGSSVIVNRAPARVLDCGSEEWFTPFDLETVAAEDLPRVEIFYNYQQAGGEAISAFAAAGVKGIVTAGTGAGGIASAAGQARTAAVNNQGVWFVSTTRTGSGTVDSGTGNIIPGGDLLPQKARLLLLLSRTFTEDVSVAREWFATLGAPSFDSSALAASVDPTPGGAEPEPTEEPTPEPTGEPTGEPSGEPSEEPSAEPTAEPTPDATETPAAGAVAGAGGGDGLASTGLAGIGGLSLAALLLIAVGAITYLRRRRRLAEHMLTH
ncbi:MULTISPECIES: asparaginase [unclassified Microbacterium]|uniref:asparaginase n=1 Tax=unclassified Microbacterium TaxID=2609290 RepID=UPI001F0C1D7B|nr:asparaginase [Microbacterium sp. ABRD28]